MILRTLDDPWWVWAVLAACGASGVIGIGLAIALEDPTYLWLCLPWVIFLS